MIGKVLCTLEIFDKNNIFLTQIDFALPSKAFSTLEPVTGV